jgi:hypothetical protein
MRRGMPQDLTLRRRTRMVKAIRKVPINVMEAGSGTGVFEMSVLWLEVAVNAPPPPPLATVA